MHSRFLEIKREAAEGKTFDWEFERAKEKM